MLYKNAIMFTIKNSKIYNRGYEIEIDSKYVNKSYMVKMGSYAKAK